MGAGERRSSLDFVDGIERGDIVQAADRSHRWECSAGKLAGNACAAHAGVDADAINGEVIGIGPLPAGAELAGFPGIGGRSNHTRHQVEKACEAATSRW